MARIRTQKFQQKMKALRGAKKNVIQDAFKYFRSITPKDTGNARRNTKLVDNTIVAEYEYASVLDKGRHMTKKGPRGSKQAPRGMTEPTIKKFSEWLRKFIRTI